MPKKQIYYYSKLKIFHLSALLKKIFPKNYINLRHKLLKQRI